MASKYIYTVTVIELCKTSYPVKRTRVVGWYSDKDAAVKTVENNELDIGQSGYYNFAVIEKVSEGTYAEPSNEESEVWYAWNSNLSCYLKIMKKPRILSGIVLFGIG